RLHLHRGARLGLGADVVAQTGIGQRRVIVPARRALRGGDAAKHIHRFVVIAVADIVVGGLHLGAFGACVAARLKAAEAERVKPETDPEGVLVAAALAAGAAIPARAGRSPALRAVARAAA